MRRARRGDKRTLERLSAALGGASRDSLPIEEYAEICWDLDRQQVLALDELKRQLIAAVDALPFPRTEEQVREAMQPHIAAAMEMLEECALVAMERCAGAGKH